MDFVKYSVLDEISIITIDRTKQLNSLNMQVLDELEHTIDCIDLAKIRCIIITGAGEKAFVAGADIAQMLEMDVRAARSFSLRGNNLFNKIENIPIPVIAGINGYALGGGCELALSCDIRIASEKSVFGLPETSLGITPGFGGTQRLAREIGLSKAKEMIFSAKPINARQALDIGLISYIYPNEGFLNQVIEFAQSISVNAPIAVQNAKIAIGRGFNCDINTGTSIESELFSSCFTTEDRKAAMQYFISKSEKRPFINK